MVKSLIKIPKSIIKNTSNDNININRDENAKLYLIDAFRTPIGQLFDLNEFIRNFHTENHESNNQKSLIGDLCVHVGELIDDKYKTTDNSPKQDSTNENSNNKVNPNMFNRHYLPEFNCLYLSPANFWSNDINLFKEDEDIMGTINDSKLKLVQKEDDKSTEESNENEQQSTTQNNNWYSMVKSKLANLLSADEKFHAKTKLTQLKELLFGVSWPYTLSSLEDDFKLNDKLKRHIKNEFVDENSKYIVFTYAITIALKKYDKSFLEELKSKLEKKLDSELRKSLNNKDISFNSIINDANDENTIVNLQYTKQSLFYYIPFVLLYFLLFLYIYISVRKIEFVKSKWGQVWIY